MGGRVGSRLATEILDPIVPVGAVLIGGIAHIHLTKIGVEYVCTMDAAVHPGLDDRSRVDVPGRDIFSDRP